MEEPISKEEMIESGALAQGPIPGQALTETPDSKNAWETPPEIVDLDEGIAAIFMKLTEPESLPSVLELMSKRVPVSVIASAVLVQGFKEGKWLPQLMALLLEPVMYILIALAEKAGIDPVVYEDEDDEDDTVPLDKEDYQEQIESYKPSSFQGLKPKNLRKESLPADVKAELESIKPEQLQSLLARSPEQEPSLLAAGE
tara:strand:- start:171 stop:770 length:600 start_codon:yes stop_codon:yes gene_type:complete